MLSRAIRGLASRRALKRSVNSLIELLRPGAEKANASPIELIYFPNTHSHQVDHPCRILFVAPRFDYGDPRRGIGIEENFFLHAFVNMGHQVVRFDPLALRRLYGRDMMNSMLLEVAMRYAPDAMFSVMFRNELQPATVAQITQDLEGRTVNWFCDDQWRFQDYSRLWAPYFGKVVTTSRSAYAQYRAAGLDNVILSQWGCNHFLYRPLPLKKDMSVTFVGQPHGERPKVIEELHRAGIPAATFGFGWPSGKISQSAMIRMFSRTHINLNLSNASVGSVDQVKGRDFEVPGCGGFLITKLSPEISDYYVSGREIETYRDTDELIDKVRFYVAHPDQSAAIAAAGYARTIAEHTMARRLTEVLDQVLGTHRR